MNPTLRVIIVGAGPRCVSLLEEFSIWEKTDLSRLWVTIVDRKCSGSGVHKPEQEEFLITNTRAGEISLEQGLCPQTGSGFNVRSTLGTWAGIDEGKCVSRGLLGRYLEHSYCALRARCLKRGIARLDEIKTTAQSCKYNSHNNRYEIELEDGSLEYCDVLVLATGHVTHEDGKELESIKNVMGRFAGGSERYIGDPYDFIALNRIPPLSNCGVAGLGLAAIDVFMALTLGRGGKFESQVGGKLRYIPSGLEPNIVAFSRSGRFMWSRAIDQKGIWRYEPAHLTLENIQGLRDSKRQWKDEKGLDFDRDVVPLLLKDMVRASDQCGLGWNSEKLQRILHSPELFQRAKGVKEFLREDIALAELGNKRSPLKAATDVIRDLRDYLREAVEHQSLSQESRYRFWNYWSPRFQCLAAGPPVERMKQILALCSAGVINIINAPTGGVGVCKSGQFHVKPISSSPMKHYSFHYLVKARADGMDLSSVRSNFLRSIVNERLGLPVFLSDKYGAVRTLGFQVHPNGRLKNEVSSRNIYALGLPTEGSHYYTNILPAPGRKSRFTRDAQRVSQSIRNYIHERDF